MPEHTLPIVQYWHQEEIPASIEKMFASFRDLNPEMRHLVFSESSSESFIEEHFGSREASAFRACAVPAMQADYLRYCAVHALGGMYFDADSRCLGSLSPLMTGGGELFRNPRGTGINNAFLIFGAPGHPLLRLAVEICTANIERRVLDKVWLATGPAVLRALVELRDAGSFDAFREAIGDSVPRWLSQLAGEAMDAAGDYATVSNAFEGVRVSPRARLDGFIVHDGSHLPYKYTDDHVANFKGSIYR